MDRWMNGWMGAWTEASRQLGFCEPVTQLLSQALAATQSDTQHATPHSAPPRARALAAKLRQRETRRALCRSLFLPTFALLQKASRSTDGPSHVAIRNSIHIRFGSWPNSLNGVRPKLDGASVMMTKASVKGVNVSRLLDADSVTRIGREKVPEYKPKLQKIKIKIVVPDGVEYKSRPPALEKRAAKKHRKKRG